MKLNGRVFFSPENLFKAYLSCRKHKRHTINALRFEARLLDNLSDLRNALVSGAYHPSTSICFVQNKPKLREIFAADFRDRVVHHLLVGHLEPKYERIFIHDSYACRKGKGVHAAVDRLKAFLQKVTQNGTVEAWYLKEDIRGFFMNLDQEILYSLVCQKFERDDVRRLSGKIIFHKCTKDYRFKGNRALLDRIPPHKTLFKVGAKKGLPIGNLTSQFFANVYLNELDQFVKRQLKCRYYLRYCDDFLLLSHSREQLLKWHAEIERFLQEKLLLKLNQSQYRLRPVSSGIDFLGYVVRRRYVLVRRRVVNNLKERIRRFDGKLGVRDRDGVIREWRYPEGAMATFRSTVSSYLGHIQKADSRNLKKALFAKHPVLRAAFILDGNRLMPRYAPKKGNVMLRKVYYWWAPDPFDKVLCPGEIVFRPVWTPCQTLRYYSQSGVSPEKASPDYARLFDQIAAENQEVLVFFQVGQFYEFYGYQAELACRVLGLKKVTGLRGFRMGCGFHRKWLKRFVFKAVANGFHVAVVVEEKRGGGRVERRMSAFIRGQERSVCKETGMETNRGVSLKERMEMRAARLEKAVQLELPFTM